MLVLIAGILGGALHMAQSALEKGENKILQMERLKVSYTLMEAQIQSLQPYLAAPDGQRKIFFSGSRDKLLISSSYSLWRTTRSNVVVAYEVAQNATGKQSLKVTERLSFQEMTDETNLLDGCDGIHFDYFMKNGLEEGTWVADWSGSETAIPEKIRINLDCNGRKISYVFNAFAKPSEVTLSSRISVKK